MSQRSNVQIRRIKKLLKSLKRRRLLKDKAVAYRTGKLGEANPQPQSSFFNTLPLEIRISVYKELFRATSFYGDIHIQWSWSEDRLTCVTCDTKDKGFEVDFSSYNGPHSTCYSRSKRKENYLQGCMAVLTSCRKIYQEAIAILYKNIAFHTAHVLTAHRFLVHIPSQAFHNITSLHLLWDLDAPLYLPDTPYKRVFHKRRPYHLLATTIIYDQGSVRTEENRWEQFGRLIARMRKLTKLKITLYDRGYVISEKELLDPLLMQFYVEDFVVQIPWPLSVARDVFEENEHWSGFKVRRPTEDEADIYSLSDFDNREPGLRGLLRRLVGRLSR